MMITGGAGVLSVAGGVPIAQLPGRWQDAVRQYLTHGILPERRLRLLLEGNIAAVRAFADDLPGLLALVTWIEDHLPAACWGSPTQVQIWLVYVRRARGRALLAAFDEGVTHGDASAEAGP